MAIPPEYLFFGVFEPKPGAFGGGYERVVGRCFVRQVVVFVAFGDFRRYNITFLTGTDAAVAWTVLALLVFLGPAALGVAFTALRQ